VRIPDFTSCGLFQRKQIVMGADYARAESLQATLFVGSRYQNITGTNASLSNLAANQNEVQGENLRKHEIQVN